MKTIWKHNIKIADTFTIDAPQGSIPLHVDTQRGYPFLWMLVDTDKPLIPHVFYVYTTGGDLYDWEDSKKYIGTFQVDEGSFVGHLFYKIKK
jgi:hypothetical protein